MSAEKLLVMFDKVNADPEVRPVPYSDKEFYAEQIYDLELAEDFEEAEYMAEMLFLETFFQH